jgi:hypothetical protein
MTEEINHRKNYCFFTPRLSLSRVAANKRKHQHIVMIIQAPPTMLTRKRVV